ncbi:MFS transporter [Spirillospora sp. NPDC029432]|uniref:MFS transporter n=1 Tax=Spirillospora sp. NPDC029432 TaxID=3154599 RepID=UPI003451AC63
MIPTPEPAAPPRERGHTGVLIALIAIEVLAVTETAMAIAAIPTFMRVFEADSAAAGWTTTSYLLVGAACAATGGRLGDIFGRRKVLTLLLVAAACGSLISVLATDLWMVVFGRGVQGLAAGALPISYGLVRELLPARRVPLAIALLSGIVPVSAGAGSLFAGMLLDSGGWRVMFLVATALGAGAALVAFVGLPRTPGLIPRPPVDVVGAALLVPATAFVLFGFTQARGWGWTDGWVLGSILVGLVALAAWVWWERRVREPIIDVRQFGDRKILLTTLATVMVGVGGQGTVVILTPIVLQLPESAPVGMGLSPTAAGVVGLAIAVVGYGGAAASGRISQVVGARWALAVAAALYIIGPTIWIFQAQSLTGTVIAMGFTTLGSAFAFTATPNLIVEAVPPEQTGAATGMNRVVLNIGIAAGLSIGSIILATWTAPGTHLPTETALTAGCLFVIGSAAVTLLLTAFIGGSRRAEAGKAPSADVDAKRAVA